MRRTEVLQGLRQMKFEDVYGRWQERRLSQGEAANRFLREAYLPGHNARFAVAPERPETAFVADAAGGHRDILCVQEERVVGNDNTVRYRRLCLQIPPSPCGRTSSGAGAGARLSGRPARRLPRAALPGPLPGRRHARS